MEAERARPGWVKALVASLVLGLVVVALRLLVASPAGPQPIAWDRDACANCRMHVGDPRFAAQLQTEDGRVLNFDDPGCLLTYRGREHPERSVVYFRDHQGDRWLTEAEVGFVRTASTPMGYGFAAVTKGTPGAQSLEQTSASIAARHLKKESEVGAAKEETHGHQEP